VRTSQYPGLVHIAQIGSQYSELFSLAYIELFDKGLSYVPDESCIAGSNTLAD
jgi:hypothetical protein